ARRVGVARAIALGPKLIIADEPTAGLDVSVQGEVLNLLNDLREELGLAMIFITHNLNVVRHVADRLAVMYHGEFVETGDAEHIFEAPVHDYTKKLLSANLAGPGRHL
ncbi:MAG: ABC transporter ATP-binding protein, partial [Pseudomonadota bacterium]